MVALNAFLVTGESRRENVVNHHVDVGTCFMLRLIINSPVSDTLIAHRYPVLHSHFRFLLKDYSFCWFLHVESDVQM